MHGDFLAQLVKNPPAMGETWVWSQESGREGYPLPYSGLKNFMDCVVHGVAKSQTQLSAFHFHGCARGWSKDSVWKRTCPRLELNVNLHDYFIFWLSFKLVSDSFSFKSAHSTCPINEILALLLAPFSSQSAIF